MEKIIIILAVLIIVFFIATRWKAPKRGYKRGGDIELPKDDGRYKPNDKDSPPEEFENPPKGREPQVK